jgi:molybdate transport system ATP-binding protein
VLLLRALLKRPPLLILDEPFAGMDKGMLDHVNAFLNEKLDPKQSAIIISHYEDEIPIVFDKGIMLEAGKIVSRY